MFITGILALHDVAMAQVDTPAKPKTTTPAPNASPKSAYNTKIYENTEDSRSFTDTVKLVRDMDGNAEVLFMKQGGVYQAPTDSTAMSKLVESQINKSAVRVTVDVDSRRINSVLAVPSKATTGGQ